MHYRKTATDHIEDATCFFLCEIWQNTFGKELVQENMVWINLKVNLVWDVMKS